MEQIADYGHAIVALALFPLIGLVLGPVSAARKSADGLVAGSAPETDYANPSYRLHRAFQNAMETCGFFTAVTVAAVLAGASPFWVNLLASVFLISRLLLAVVHIRGVGAQNMGPRTFIYVLGWACCMILGIMAAVAAF